MSKYPYIQTFILASAPQLPYSTLIKPEKGLAQEQMESKDSKHMALRMQTQQYTAATQLGPVIRCTQLRIILQSSLFQLVSHKIRIQKPLFFSTIFSFFQKE